MLSLSCLGKSTIRHGRKIPIVNCKRVINMYFSSSNSDVDKKDDKKPNGSWNIVMSVLHLVERNTKTVAIGGGVVVALGITRGLYSMAHSFLTLTPYQAMYYGFIGGIVTTGSVAAFIHFSERAFHINPDRAVHAAMKILYKNNDLKSVLGSGVHASHVKTFSSTSGGFGIRKSTPTWVSPEIQTAFIVQGNGGEALVTVVYNKVGIFGNEVLSYVGVEWVDQSTGNVVTSTLKGDADRFESRSALKSHAVHLSKKYLRS